MALPFNGDFLLLESSPGEQPGGEGCLSPPITNCFSCGLSHSPEHGRLIPGGNKHSITPPKFGVTWRGGLTCGHHIAPHGEHAGPPQMESSPFPPAIRLGTGQVFQPVPDTLI